MEAYSKENKYLRAKERVRELKKFYSNLTSYVVVITFLAVINYYTNGWSYMWFLWAAFGWGIGVVFHALGTFNVLPFCGRGWEERKIQELMQQEDEEAKRWK